MAKIQDNSPVNDAEDRYALLEALLPFVSLSEESDTPWWNVPQVGNYHFGYCIGETMAHTLMKYYKNHQRHDDFPHQITSIVSSMMIHFAKLDGLTFETDWQKERSPEYKSFHGQYVGFFNTIGELLSRQR